MARTRDSQSRNMGSNPVSITSRALSQHVKGIGRWSRNPATLKIGEDSRRAVKEKRLAKRNGKELSILPNPGGVGMKNNSFTSVIRKPYRGVGVKRNAGTGEHLYSLCPTDESTVRTLKKIRLFANPSSAQGGE